MIRILDGDTAEINSRAVVFAALHPEERRLATLRQRANRVPDDHLKVKQVDARVERATASTRSASWTELKDRLDSLERLLDEIGVK